MNKADRQQPGAETQSLNHWIESVLFGMNLLLTVLGTVLIARFRSVSLDMFQDFGVEMSTLTELAFSTPYVCILPVLGMLAFAVRFLVESQKLRLGFHLVHFFTIIAIATIFVGTTLPAVHRLLDQLQ